MLSPENLPAAVHWFLGERRASLPAFKCSGVLPSGLFKRLSVSPLLKAPHPPLTLFKVLLKRLNGPFQKACMGHLCLIWRRKKHLLWKHGPSVRALMECAPFLRCGGKEKKVSKKYIYDSLLVFTRLKKSFKSLAFLQFPSIYDSYKRTLDNPHGKTFSGVSLRLNTFLLQNWSKTSKFHCLISTHVILLYNIEQFTLE